MTIQEIEKLSNILEFNFKQIKILEDAIGSKQRLLLRMEREEILPYAPFQIDKYKSEIVAYNKQIEDHKENIINAIKEVR